MSLMRFLGFDNDEDDYDEAEDYADEQPRNSRKQKPRRRNDSTRSDSGSLGGGLILFRGIPTDQDKRRLREAFNKGKMILLDLNDMTPHDFEEYGRPLRDFMSGVAFACGGEIEYIKPSQYIVTPREGMFEVWPEEVEQE